MKVLTIVDLQEEFDAFENKARVLSYVIDLVRNGVYDFIINLSYSGGQFGHDRPTPTIKKLKRVLDKKNNVIHATKDEDDGSWNIMRSLKFSGKKFSKKDLEVDLVGVNLPFCVTSTAEGLLRNGLKPKNIHVHMRGCSMQKIKRSAEEKVRVIKWMKSASLKLVK